MPENLPARPLLLSIALCAATVAAGIAVRFAPLHLPSAIVKYGGSMLWALLIYWLVSTGLPRWPAHRAALLAAAIAASVEFFKLYRSPQIDAFRGTLPGILILGRYFSLWDILAYWIAIALGAWADPRLRPRSTR